jgi:hypothetical protein
METFFYCVLYKHMLHLELYKITLFLVKFFINLLRHFVCYGKMKMEQEEKYWLARKSWAATDLGWSGANC